MSDEIERRRNSELEAFRTSAPIWLRDAYDLMSRSGQAKRIEEATGRNALRLLEDLSPAVRSTVRKLMDLQDGTRVTDELIASGIEQALTIPAIARNRYYKRLSGGDAPD